MTDPVVTVALISLIGTLVGSISGVLVSNKLSNYRIEQLEKKLDNYAEKNDEMRERMVKVEESTKSAHHRLDGIVQQLNIHERRE